MKTILCKEGYLIPKKSLDEETLLNIKSELTVEPYKIFDYKKKDEDDSFTVYSEDDKYISVPKFYGLNKFGPPKKNKEINGLTVNMTFKGDLRDNQKEVVKMAYDRLSANNGGLLSLPCGFGKTVIAINLACQLKLKTLVVVHKGFLLSQWKERIQQYTDASVGIIQQNKIEIEGNQFVIAMLQSVAKDKYETDVFSDFGLVIFDEAHHAPSKYFSRALPIINCSKTLALSATPNRADKLEKVLFWFFGDLIYKAPPALNNTVLVKIIKYNLEHEKFREIKMRFGCDVNRPKTINNLTTIGRRNKFIVDIIEELLEEPERKILVLSDRVEHLKSLKERFDQRELASADFYIGGTKQSKLDEAAKCQVIFATYSMAAEALDIPDLNSLIFTTPRREIEQSVGRILRKVHANVQPTIIDMVDELNTFVKQGYYRRNFYRKKGFKIHLIEVENNEIKNDNILGEDITDVFDPNEHRFAEEDKAAADVDFLDD